MRRLIMILLCAAVSAPGLAGCQATASSARDDTQLALAMPTMRIDPPAAGRNRIWVEFQDQTGQGIDLYDDVVAAVEARGYATTPDFQEADYALWATMRIFDKAGEDFDDRYAALGGVAGGIAVGTAVGVATDNPWAGVAAGGAAAGPIAWLTRSLTREVAWAMVVDVQLARRVHEGGVEVDIDVEGSRSALSSSGLAAPGGMERGSGSDDVRSSASVTETRARLELEQRILASTHGTRMDRSVAQAAIIPRLRNSLGQLLPRAR